MRLVSKAAKLQLCVSLPVFLARVYACMLGYFLATMSALGKMLAKFRHVQSTGNVSKHTSASVSPVQSMLPCSEYVIHVDAGELQLLIRVVFRHLTMQHHAHEHRVSTRPPWISFLTRVMQG